MANDDQELGDVLRATLRAQSLHKGPCPPVERLLEYQAHKLSQEAECEVHAHLVACGFCEAFLLRVEHFTNETAAPTPWRTAIRFLSRPLIAYSFAALFLIVLLGVGRKPAFNRVGGPAIAAEAVPAFDLPQTRGDQDTVVRPGGEGRFILRFFVTAEPGTRYLVAIRHGTIGHEDLPVEPAIPLNEIDARGNVELVCRTDAFSAGPYVLTISEEGSSRLFQYFFQVH